MTYRHLTKRTRFRLLIRQLIFLTQSTRGRFTCVTARVSGSSINSSLTTCSEESCCELENDEAPASARIALFLRGEGQPFGFDLPISFRRCELRDGLVSGKMLS